MTPTGVEHLNLLRDIVIFIFVVPSMTPTGVEHPISPAPSPGTRPVVPSMTPTGVEHPVSRLAANTSLRGSFNDADRR